MRLFRWNCKHDYHCFNSESYQSNYHTFYYGTMKKWYFICRNCKKETKVYEVDILNYMDKMEIKVAKEHALGEDMSKYENERFRFHNFSFKGKMAYYMRKKYGHYKLD